MSKSRGIVKFVKSKNGEIKIRYPFFVLLNSRIKFPKHNINLNIVLSYLLWTGAFAQWTKDGAAILFIDTRQDGLGTRKATWSRRHAQQTARFCTRLQRTFWRAFDFEGIFEEPGNHKKHP